MGIQPIKMRKLIICISIFLILVSVSGCNTNLMAKTVTIDNLSWDATADIQEWKIDVEESGWELPEGATIIKEKQEAKSYKIVGFQQPTLSV